MNTQTRYHHKSIVWFFTMAIACFLVLFPQISYAAEKSTYAYLNFYTVNGEEIDSLQKKIGEKNKYQFKNPDAYKYLSAKDESGNEVYPEIYYQVTGERWDEVDEDGNIIGSYKEGDMFRWSSGPHYFFVKTDNPTLTGENAQHISFEGQVHLYFQNANGDEIYSLQKTISPKDEYTFVDPAKYTYLFQANIEDPGSEDPSAELSGTGIRWYCEDDNEKEYLFKKGDRARFRAGEYYFTILTDDPIQITFYYPIDFETYYIDDDKSGAVYATGEASVGDTIYLKKSLGAILSESTFRGWREENFGGDTVYGGGASFTIMKREDLDFFAVYEYDENWNPNAVDENTGEFVDKKDDEINIADIDTINEAAGAGYGVSIDANGILQRTGQQVQINSNVKLKGIPGTIKKSGSLSSLKSNGDPTNPEDYTKDKYGNKMEDSELGAEINNVLKQDDSAMYMDVYGNAFVYYSSLSRKNNLLLALDRLSLGKTDSWVRNVSSFDSEMIKRFEAIEFALIYGTYPKTAADKKALKDVGVEWKDSYISETAFNKLKAYKKTWSGWYDTYSDGLFEKYKSKTNSGTTVVGALSDSLKNSINGIFGNVTAYAKDTTQKNGLGLAYQVGSRTNVSLDLDDVKFKPQYFDPTRIYSVSTYSFAQLEGLNDEQIRILTRIFNELVSYGFSEAAAAGACGNLWQESNFNIKAHNSSGYYGMIQWGGGRATNLLSLAASMGSTWDDVDVQIAMMQNELNSGYLTQINRYLASFYSGSSMQTETNPEAAAEAWAIKYEGCICYTSKGWHSSHSERCQVAANGTSYQELQVRKQRAVQVYAAMTKRSGGAGEGGSFAGMTNREILEAIFGANTVDGIMAKYGYQYSRVKPQMTTVPYTDSTGKTRYITCHRAIADDLQSALNEISASGFYLKDAACYVERTNTSDSSRWSFHALGLAVDINYEHNPQFYMSESAAGLQKYNPNIDPLAVTLQEYYIFKSYGFLWGRDFSSRPDLMHFVIGEVGQDGKNAWISQQKEGAQ